MIFVFSSFDIVGNLDVLGFNIRIFYVLVIFTFIYEIILSRCVKLKFSLPVIFLIIWVFLQLISIYNSIFYIRAFGYWIWLFLNIILIIQHDYIAIDINRVFKLYVLSFFILSIIGLLQFVLYYCGINFLIYSVWNLRWITLPRIRGVNFEPSFYATYLVPGVIASFFCFRDNVCFKKIFSFIIFVICLMSVILSSSRMVILILSLFFVIYFIVYMFKQLLRGKSKSVYLYGTAIVIIVVLGILVFMINNPILFFGTGIGNYGDSSVSIRLKDMFNTVKVFKSHPLIGVSLGGIAPNIAMNNNSYQPYNNVVTKFEGINVILEILAGSGILGSGFFIVAMFIILFNLINQKRLVKNLSERRYLLTMVDAIFLGTVLQFTLLLLNQNILRPYFWIQLFWGLILTKELKDEKNLY